MLTDKVDIKSQIQSELLLKFMAVEQKLKILLMCLQG